MDVSRGHLVEDINSLPVELRSRYTPVPTSLLEEARQELGGRAEAYVSPERQSALNAWAAKKRKKQRAKAKLAKVSRSRNRKA